MPNGKSNFKRNEIYWKTTIFRSVNYVWYLGQTSVPYLLKKCFPSYKSQFYIGLNLFGTYCKIFVTSTRPLFLHFDIVDCELLPISYVILLSNMKGHLMEHNLLTLSNTRYPLLFFMLFSVVYYRRCTHSFRSWYCLFCVTV